MSSSQERLIGGNVGDGPGAGARLLGTRAGRVGPVLVLVALLLPGLLLCTGCANPLTRAQKLLGRGSHSKALAYFALAHVTGAMTREELRRRCLLMLRRLGHVRFGIAIARASLIASNMAMKSGKDFKSMRGWIKAGRILATMRRGLIRRRR